MEKVIKKAYSIAKKGLKTCRGKEGYFAAWNHFRNYWGRDAFMAAFGSVYLHDFEIVKKQLLFFIKYQKKSGHIPRLILRNGILRFVFMNLERFFDNPFVSPYLTYFSRDQNSLFVICAWEYIKKSKDYTFAKKYFDNLERAISWNFKFDLDKDFLLEQDAYSDWQDSIKKNPETLFTNVCSYKAVLCLSEIAGMIKMPLKKKQYSFMAQMIKKQINKAFFTGEFYTDSLKINELAADQKKPIFAGGGNMLAVYWGLADKVKTRKIFNFIKNHNLENFSIEVNYPNYPDKSILFLFRILRFKEYHNEMIWLWVGLAGVLAYKKTGYKDKALELLTKISRKIVEYNEVYEVYEPTGEPVKRLFYKSAFPFAWSAGLFIYAVEKMKIKYKI